ncbi:hypothetical protein P3L10_018917 [Capsicum annuum]
MAQQQIPSHPTCHKHPMARFGVYNANYFRMLWRTAHVIVTAVIAMIFPFVNAILGLIGAASFYPLTVYFPIEMHIAQKKIPKYSFTWIWFANIELGLFDCITLCCCWIHRRPYTRCQGI